MSSDYNKVLSEPIMPELTDTERKIKNNLIAFSVVAIFMCYWKLSIVDSPSVLGLKFNGLDQHKIYVALGLFIVYSVCHYLWHVYDLFIEWRLRWTAISELRPLRAEGFHSNSDLPNKRNNTLYHWWNYTEKYISNSYEINEALINSIKAIEEKIPNDEFSHVTNSAIILSLIETKKALTSSNKDTLDLKNLLQSPPFVEALPKFNNAFSHFLKSQNIRWIIFECLIPFGLALTALCFISTEVFSF